MMRTLVLLGLGLYGAANLFAGIYDFAVAKELAGHTQVALVLTGALLTVSAVVVARRTQHARIITISSLVLAFVLAVYNERVLGLGQPIHHLFRGTYSLLLLWPVFRLTRPDRRSD
jgi:hypothetical protein